MTFWATAYMKAGEPKKRQDPQKLSWKLRHSSVREVHSGFRRVTVQRWNPLKPMQRRTRASSDSTIHPWNPPISAWRAQLWKRETINEKTTAETAPPNGRHMYSTGTHRSTADITASRHGRYLPSPFRSEWQLVLRTQKAADFSFFVFFLVFFLFSCKHTTPPSPPPPKYSASHCTFCTSSETETPHKLHD